MTGPRAIGGDLELDPQLLLRSIEEPRPLEPEGVLCDTGRSALAVARRIVEAADDPPEVFVLPAYLCESVLTPFAGAKVELYPVGATLEPDAATIEELAAGRRACVVAIDYFGFPARELEGLRDRHIVIEDAAGGSLVELPDHAAGRLGDLVLTSFRKYAPVPDGALLTGPLARAETLPPADARLVTRRLLAKLMRHELLAGGPPELEAAALALVARHEQDIDGAPQAAMSALSHHLLAQLDLRSAAARRRANFEALRDALAGDRELVPVYDALPDGVSPLAFPLRVPEDVRDALRAELIRRRAYCAVHWPLPAAVDQEAFGPEAMLSRQMLSLPLDQRYELDDMHDLATRLRQAFEAVR